MSNSRNEKNPMQDQINELQKMVVALDEKVSNNSPSQFVGMDFTGQELFKFYMQAVIQSALGTAKLSSILKEENHQHYVDLIYQTAHSLTMKTLDKLS